MDAPVSASGSYYCIIAMSNEKKLDPSCSRLTYNNGIMAITWSALSWKMGGTDCPCRPASGICAVTAPSIGVNLYYVM